MERIIFRKLSLVVVFVLVAMPFNFLMDTVSISHAKVSGNEIESEFFGHRFGTGAPFTKVFEDDFEGNLNKWPTNTGVELNSEASPPGPPASQVANLDGQGDTLISQTINMEGFGYGFLTYWITSQGDGDMPELGDDLSVEIELQGVGWMHVYTSRQEETPLPPFMAFPINLTLPSDAFHSSFRIRITTPTGDGQFMDDWYIDDLKVIAKYGITHFSDEFPTNNLDPQKWPSTTGSPSVETYAQNEPSSQYSLNLDGSGDAVISQSLDLSRYGEGYVCIYVEEGDGSPNCDDPEETDFLLFYFWSPQGTWESLNMLDGAQPGFSKFSIPFMPILLQIECFHEEFKLKMETLSGEPGDDWFVDNIELITADNSVELFSDEFENSNLDQDNWPSTLGTPQVNQEAQGEPSAPLFSEP